MRVITLNIWMEWNARIFHNKYSLHSDIISKIIHMRSQEGNECSSALYSKSNQNWSSWNFSHCWSKEMFILTINIKLSTTNFNIDWAILNFQFYFCQRKLIKSETFKRGFSTSNLQFLQTVLSKLKLCLCFNHICYFRHGVEYEK